MIPKQFKSSIIAVMILLMPAFISASDFIIKVDTSKKGFNASKVATVGDYHFKIQVDDTSIYDYNVDCGGGGATNGTHIDGNYTCEYTSAGEYDINISDGAGDDTGFPHLYMNNNNEKHNDPYGALSYRDGDAWKIIEIVQWGDLKWTSFYRAFAGCKNLNKVPATGKPDLTDVSSLNGMFMSLYTDSDETDAVTISVIPNIDTWVVDSITDMGYLFAGLTDFDGDVRGWNTSNVENMTSIFEKAESFNQDLSGWDTSKVRGMSAMFKGAKAFNKNITGWDTSSATTMSSMFSEAEAFNQDIKDWNTTNVESMAGMFKGAKVFNQDLKTDGDKWNTSKVEDMHFMFNNAIAFNGDITNWDTSLVTTFQSMFNAAKVFNQDISDWETNSATTMYGMFANAYKFDQPIKTSSKQWDTSKVETMAAMFKNAKVFNQDIGSWDTAKVETFDSMFNGAKVFNQDIHNWDTHSATKMYGMFANTNDFNQSLTKDGAKWDTSHVTTMSFMFKGAKAFNQDISNWDTSSVSNFDSMFYLALVFNQDISGWTTSSATNMKQMFRESGAFNQDINGWNTENVTTMEFMFFANLVFDQDISGWDVSRVTNMNRMFERAIFNQDIGNWGVTNVNASGMFTDANLSIRHYDSLLNGWEDNSLKPVDVNSNFNAGFSEYCLGRVARASIISMDNNWSITDSGENCTGFTPVSVTINDGGDETINAKERDEGVSVTVELHSDRKEGDILHLDTDGNGVADITYILTATDELNGTVVIDVPKANIPESGTMTASVTVTVPNAQNDGPAVEDTSTVDSTRPSVTITEVITEDNGTVTVKGTTEANIEVTVTFTDGTEVTVTSDATGHYEATSINAQTTGGDIKAIATDATGNKSEIAEQEFTVWYDEDEDGDSVVITHTGTNTTVSTSTELDELLRDEDADKLEIFVSSHDHGDIPDSLKDGLPEGCDLDSYAGYIKLYHESGEVETGYAFTDPACGTGSDGTLFEGKRLNFVKGSHVRMIPASAEMGGMVIIVDLHLGDEVGFGER